MNDLKARAEEAAKELSKTQARYKRNYDARRRRGNPAVRVGSHVFVRVERPDKQEESRHKLLPIAAGPFKVVDLDENTVVIKTGEYVERVSHDRVEFAPDPQVEVQVSGRTKEEEEEISSPVVVQAPSSTEQRSESDKPKEVHPRM
ncbi:unnamed protein product [Agarophyton chilense]